MIGLVLEKVVNLQEDGEILVQKNAASEGPEERSFWLVLVSITDGTETETLNHEKHGC